MAIGNTISPNNKLIRNQLRIKTSYSLIFLSIISIIILQFNFVFLFFIIPSTFKKKKKHNRSDFSSFQDWQIIELVLQCSRQLRDLIIFASTMSRWNLLWCSLAEANTFSLENVKKNIILIEDYVLKKKKNIYRGF